ncbi:hypothetical protein NAB1_2027 [Lactiplantibacillus plantarum]|nr:LPXTG cell wall anchor domain-containing protein [Lactiplantibacillus plantarum]KZV00574.1 hypothetical protein NAB1_2027 [Lactiplantibacillus plantarum]
MSRNQAEQSRTSQPSQAESDQSVVQTNQQKTAASVSGIGWVSAPAVSKRTTKHHLMTTLPQTDEQNTQLSLLGMIGLALSSILGWLKISPAINSCEMIPVVSCGSLGTGIDGVNVPLRDS